ncbi:MAG: metalloregulator ArsR/SmtB family transcription factor [Rhodoglobus sp.]|nr:metalloregulator ArsR/SmtB family transcription factor [Rhodoglobus sp.]
MADIFDVIADETRRQVLAVLLERYISEDSAAGDISVGEIVEHLGLTQPTVSKHLRVLRDHGLVTVREDGQHRYYSLDSSPLEDIEDWLVPFLSADFDDDQLDAAVDESAVFAAWSGADVGDSIGRRIAEGSYQARSVIQDASERVARRLPRRFSRRRPSDE